MIIEEIIYIIYTFLTVRDIVKLNNTNKLFFKVYESKSLWRYFYHRDFNISTIYDGYMLYKRDYCIEQLFSYNIRITEMSYNIILNLIDEGRFHLWKKPLIHTHEYARIISLIHLYNISKQLGHYIKYPQCPMAVWTNKNDKNMISYINKDISYYPLKVYISPDKFFISKIPNIDIYFLISLESTGRRAAILENICIANIMRIE